MLPASFILVSLFLNILSGFSYLVAMRKGLARPNQVTWALWALAPLIGSAAQIASGVGWPTLLALGSGLVPLVIFLYSFRTGHEPWVLKPFDFICGLMSLAALVVWALTRNPLFALGLSILSDAFAAWPTVLKAYNHPETEDKRTYLLTLFANAFAFLTFPDFAWVTIGFGVYLLAVTILLSVLTTFPHVRLKGCHTQRTT